MKKNSSPKSERAFVGLVREVCAARGIRVAAYHGDWVLTLSKGARSEHVFGYDFSLNSTAAQQIAKDKAATYSILSTARVPAVEHELVMSPVLPDYMPVAGNWEHLHRRFEAWGRDMVCKPNDGTGGRDVFRVRDQVQLERAVHTLLAKSRACAISPFVEIKDEFRVFMLDDDALLVYRKKRPVVTGDGKRRLIDLLAEWLSSDGKGRSSSSVRLKAIGKIEIETHDLDAVLPTGKIVHVNWRHNLGQGAAPEELATDTRERARLVSLAQKAMRALRLRVASVDIVVGGDGKLRVLELNSGIMMEQFSVGSRKRAADIYGRIVERVFTDS